MDSPCYTDPNPWVFKVWMRCLLSANHTKTSFSRNGTKIELLPGQFPYSRTAWAEEMSIPKSTLRNIIEKLQKWDTIEDTYKDTQKVTIFQIKNWEIYQSQDTQEDTQEDTRRTHGGHTEDTPKNVRIKESKKSKNTNPPVPLEKIKNEVYIYWEQFIAPITVGVDTQHKASATLLNRYGIDMCKQMIEVVAHAHQNKFANKEVKPRSLNTLINSWDDLIIYAKSQHAIKKDNKTAVYN